MPDYTCYCGAGFYISYKKIKQHISGMQKFCGSRCLLKYIKDQPVTDEFKLDHITPSKIAEPYEFWDEELQMYFRSSYESIVGRFLDRHEFKWVYEMWTINIKESQYTPDFWLNDFDIFLEVKGLWGVGSKKKLYQAYKHGYHILLLPDYLIQKMRKDK